MAWNSTKPTSTSKIKLAPSVILSNWEAIEDWTEQQHYSIANTLSGSHNPGQCSVLMTDATSSISALTNYACAAALDITLGVFKYNNGTAWINIGGPIAAGTAMLFYEDTAPIGWTLATTLNDKVVFITKGSANAGQPGGQSHSVGSWTITGFGGTVDDEIITEHTMPAHSHGIAGGSNVVPGGMDTSAYIGSGYTGSTGGSSGHSHTLGAMNQNGTWRPAAYNCIICTKD